MIEVDSNSARAKMVRLAGTGKRVLELGHSTDYTSHLLKDRGCHIVAVEMDAAATTQAPSFCQRAIVDDIEQIDLARELGEDRFDVVIAENFLEYLKDPLSLLRTVKTYLRPEGYIVTSITNVAHASVRLALLGGRFHSNGSGVLDRRQLQFYTRETMEKLFEDAGFAIGHLERQEKQIGDTEGLYDQVPIPEDLLKALSRDPDALTYQFVVVAYPMPQESLNLIQRRFQELAEEKDAAQREVTKLREVVEKQIEQVEALTEDKEATQREVAELRGIAEEQKGQLDALTARVELMTGRESELRDMLLDAHDQLLRRDAEIQASLAAALQRQQNALGARAAAPAKTDQQGSVPSKYIRYQQMIHLIREAVRTTLPDDATVVVVSKGDDELLNLDGRQAWHFPRNEDGEYAGYYPANSAAAIAHLEALRAEGAGFLLLPSTAFWWLEHYREFSQHLEAHYPVVVRREDACAIFNLREPKTSDTGTENLANVSADVTLAEPDRQRLWGFYIDSSKSTSQSGKHELEIEGWVLGRSSPAVAVEVMHEDSVVRRVPIVYRRPDVAAAYAEVPKAEQSGFRITVEMPGIAELALEVRAVLKDQSRVSLSTIRARSRWREETDESLKSERRIAEDNGSRIATGDNGKRPAAPARVNWYKRIWLKLFGG